MIYTYKLIKYQIFLSCFNFFSFQYYTSSTKLWAADPDRNTEIGDIVEIKQMDEPQSARVKFFVKDIVFGVGKTRDPITGKRCKGPVFINEELRNFDGIDSTKESS